MTATRSEGTDTRRTKSSHGWESDWNQLISSARLRFQTLSQYSLSRVIARQ